MYSTADTESVNDLIRSIELVNSNRDETDEPLTVKCSREDILTRMDRVRNVRRQLLVEMRDHILDQCPDWDVGIHFGNKNSILTIMVPSTKVAIPDTLSLNYLDRVVKSIERQRPKLASVV